MSRTYYDMAKNRPKTIAEIAPLPPLPVQVQMLLLEADLAEVEKRIRQAFCGKISECPGAAYPLVYYPLLRR